MTPRGYKQIEVGVIPEDWKIVRLSEIANISSGGTPSRQNPTFWDGDIPWITTTQIDFNYVNEASEFITKSGLENSSARMYKPGTLLMAMYGQGKTRGKVAILNLSAAINQACAAIALDESISSRYVFFNLSHRYEEIRGLSNTGNQENLNIGIIGSIFLPLPPPHEQQLIAEALSEVDEELSALDAALAKKRDLKQGAMQELLTGQTRLPGFSGVWKEWSFGEIFSILKTASNSRSQLTEEGEVRYIHYGDIHQRWSTFLDCEKESLPAIEYYLVQNFPFLQDGDLIIADASEDYEGIGASVEVKNIGDIKAVSGLHTILLRGDKSLLADGFKGYLQYIPSVKRRLIELATGISVYGISKTSVQAIRVFLPSKEEQTAIAAILSEMDAEINILEAQRQKTADLKQGMMQELLTGKTRLI